MNKNKVCYYVNIPMAKINKNVTFCINKSNELKAAIEKFHS